MSSELGGWKQWWCQAIIFIVTGGDKEPSTDGLNYRYFWNDEKWNMYLVLFVVYLFICCNELLAVGAKAKSNKITAFVLKYIYIIHNLPCIVQFYFRKCLTTLRIQYIAYRSCKCCINQYTFYLLPCWEKWLWISYIFYLCLRIICASGTPRPGLFCNSGQTSECRNFSYLRPEKLKITGKC